MFDLQKLIIDIFVQHPLLITATRGKDEYDKKAKNAPWPEDNAKYYLRHAVIGSCAETFNTNSPFGMPASIYCFCSCFMSIDQGPNLKSPWNCAKVPTTWKILERSWIPYYLSSDRGMGKPKSNRGKVTPTASRAHAYSSSCVSQFNGPKSPFTRSIQGLE
ncbi:hypothetical protein P168DRAFT_78237 [Aspergillus campestris IBT 28561]|uniref:Uncharacterized protein n=1 Tax=Aspergillus campestris (strain IBT 28561) TaxID=1392248 RepID=A0A2I1CQV6_ASPC2|nr:uncharacterized protein P168DRAFT_78237 [Aspergillus campestris IBT 28561]PKY00010.1 hypothetical protein P168DRAFT_78237 [Aspergillus campestris IBT 28561]